MKGLIWGLFLITNGLFGADEAYSIYPRNKFPQGREWAAEYQTCLGVANKDLKEVIIMPHGLHCRTDTYDYIPFNTDTMGITNDQIVRFCLCAANNVAGFKRRLLLWHTRGIITEPILRAVVHDLHSSGPHGDGPST